MGLDATVCMLFNIDKVNYNECEGGDVNWPKTQWLIRYQLPQALQAFLL